MGFLQFRGAGATVAVGGLLSVVASEHRLRARRLQYLQHVGSVVVVQGPSCPVACGSLQTRDRTRVLCSGRKILNHWTSREAQSFFFVFSAFCVMLGKPLATSKLQMKL